MTPRDLQERIIQAKLRRGEFNCFGTALYLNGVFDNEQFVDSPDFTKHLDLFTPVEHPEQGDIVAFAYEGRFIHAGVILDPTTGRICHRRGYQNSIHEDFLTQLGDTMGKPSQLAFYRFLYSQPLFYRRII